MLPFVFKCPHWEIAMGEVKIWQLGNNDSIYAHMQEKSTNVKWPLTDRCFPDIRGNSGVSFCQNLYTCKKRKVYSQYM